ncbi:MAG: hypothetical protein HOQ43_07530 [Glycomyces artemisiae]|uniref:DUF732 domain-containing protein n=1 Tax=Glycomyces artemisiae TaxID=1076443 RepID=A0A850C5B9_9ACTN|nr:hypothetical protein [Glycomyces artemisiae]
MNRTTIAAALLATAAALTACTATDDSSSDSKPTPKPAASSSTPDRGAVEHAAGIPPKPTAQARADLLAKLGKVDRAIVADPDEAIDNARNQCAAINGGASRLDYLAQQRFSSGTHEVTEADGKKINAAIGEFCKTA